MRYLSSFFTLAFLCLLASGLTAQADHKMAVKDYVTTHNARVSTRNWAKVRTAPVTLQINAENELEAFVGSRDRLRIALQRETANEMDELFPRTITDAVIILTNETVIIIDQVEKLHFALSLNGTPRLPEIAGEPTLVFQGYGLGRHWSKGL